MVNDVTCSSCVMFITIVVLKNTVKLTVLSKICQEKKSIFREKIPGCWLFVSQCFYRGEASGFTGWVEAEEEAYGEGDGEACYGGPVRHGGGER